MKRQIFSWSMCTGRLDPSTMPAYAQRRDTETAAESVERAIAAKTGLHVITWATDGETRYSHHYRATLGERHRAGGYSPVAEICVYVSKAPPEGPRPIGGHVHRPIPEKRVVSTFVARIDGAVEVPEAHGNVCETDICSCGAIRQVNRNAGRRERGPWRRL